MLQHSDTIRLIAAAILFLLTLVMGTVPVYLLQMMKKCSKSKSEPQHDDRQEKEDSKPSKWFQHDRIVQFLTQIGGGVLFYTAFVHMLPEIRENYENYLKSNKTSSNVSSILAGTDQDGGEEDDNDGLPLVDMCACAGLFGIFLLEEIMHALLGGHDHHHHHHQHNHDLNPQPLAESRGSSRKRRFSLRQCMEKPRYDQQIDDEQSITNLDGQNGQNDGKTVSIGEGIGNKFPEISLSFNKKPDALTIPFSETHPISSCQQSTQCYNACTQQQCSHHEPKQHHESLATTAMEHDSRTANMANKTIVVDDLDSQPGSVWPHVIENFLLILAFSCHSIFDGISIGVQPNEEEIWTMLIAILSHKLLIAFILSFQIYEKCHWKIIDPQSGKILKQIPINGSKIILGLFSTLFALMSPIGILIVMIMNDQLSTPSESSIHVIVLAAISAGTILYIVFFEIVDKSTSRLHINGLAQWLALAIGFGSMHLISQLFHED